MFVCCKTSFFLTFCTLFFRGKCHFCWLKLIQTIIKIYEVQPKISLNVWFLARVWFSPVFLMLHWINNIISSTASKPIQIRLIRTGSHRFIEKSCIAFYCRQFSMNIKIKNIKKYQFCYVWLRPLWANNISFNLIIFHFTIRGKLSIIRCDK